MPLIINHIVLFLFHWWRNQNPSCLHTTYIYLHNNIKARPTAASHSIVPPHNPTTVTLYFNVSRGINNQARTLTIVTLFYKAVTYYPNIARSRWIYVHCIDSCLNFVLCTSYLLFCRWDIAYHVSTWKESMDVYLLWRPRIRSMNARMYWKGSWKLSVKRGQ